MDSIGDTTLMLRDLEYHLMYLLLMLLGVMADCQTRGPQPPGGIGAIEHVVGTG